jgi:adenylate cyclase
LLSRRSQALAGAAAALAGVIALRAAGSLERMELAAYDAGLRSRAAAELDARIVVVDETEDDLVRFGHPLSDEVLARVIERTLALGAAAVGVDKFRDIPVPPGSERLERLLKESNPVYWGYQFGGNGVRRIEPPRSLIGSSKTGFVDVVVDPGGTVRRSLLYLDDGGPPQPSLPLKLALAWLAPQGISPQPDRDNPELLRLGRTTLPPLEPDDGGYSGIDAAGYQILLDFRGAPEAFATVTMGELLDGKVEPAQLRGRIAIIGSSAESLKDYFHTPYSAEAGDTITGADLQAHQVSQLLRLALGESPRVRSLPKVLELGLMALCALAGTGAWLVSRSGWLAVFVSSFVLFLILVWLGTARLAVWLPVVPLVGAFMLSAAVSVGLRALREARERAQLMAIFSRHVAPEVARELWQRRDELGEGFASPRPLEATVLFADIHGYSTIAERLPPEALAPWLNGLIAPLAETIMAHRGVIRQYVGDAVMAVFGAPIPSTTQEGREADARTALACAREMCERFAALNELRRAAGQPTAGLRIGIHSGHMVGCNIGSASRVEYAVVGDAVNIAARVQALSLPEGDEGERGRILVSGATRALLPAGSELEPLGSFSVKGRQEPVEIYRA